jgi:hypothetical protein
MQDGTQINRIGSARGDQELPAPVDDPAMAEQAAGRMLIHCHRWRDCPHMPRVVNRSEGFLAWTSTCQDLWMGAAPTQR